jgi:hypothetical protein
MRGHGLGAAAPGMRTTCDVGHKRRSPSTAPQRHQATLAWTEPAYTLGPARPPSGPPSSSLDERTAMRSRRLLVLATLLGVTSVAACGGGSSGSDAEPLGTPVSVGYYPHSGVDMTGSLKVTVTGVRAGTAAELAAGGFSLDDDQKDMTPYYVDVTYQNTGSTLVQNPPSPDGQDKDGTDYSALVVIGDASAYHPCPGTPEKLAPKQTAKGCAIVMVPDGGSLARISYFPGGTESFRYWKAS